MWPDKLSLTGGAGGAAGPASGTANNGISMPLSTPFNFDDSGWVVNMGSPGASTTAGGNAGANATQQTANPVASGSTGTGQAASVAGLNLGGNTVPLMIAALGLFLVLSHKL